MKHIPLPAYIVLLVLVFFAWGLNRYLQRLIKPRASFGRLMAYMFSGVALVFAGSFAAVRLILWLFPPTLK